MNIGPGDEFGLYMILIPLLMIAIGIKDCLGF